jgi:G3E family GTPase
MTEQVDRCHTLLKKHAVLVRRLTQRLGLDRGVLFLEDEIRRLESQKPSSLRVDTSGYPEEDEKIEEEEEEEETTPRGSPKRTVQMLRERRFKNHENKIGTSLSVFRAEKDKAHKSADQGTEQMSRHQWRAAISCFDDTIESCSQMLASAYIDRSTARAKLEQWDGAASDAHFALTLYPESASAHFRLANALFGQGKDFEAYQEFTKAAAIDQSVMSSAGSRLQSLSAEELESVLADMDMLNSATDGGAFDESLLLEEGDHRNKISLQKESRIMSDTFSSVPSQDLVSSSSTLVRASKKEAFQSVSVHLITGFVGAGKSTLAQHLVESSKKADRCVILTPTSYDLDGDDEKDQKEEQAHAEHFGNGSARIFLKNASTDLLVKEAVQVAMSGRFDRIFVELRCMDEPLHAASELYSKHEEYEKVHKNDGVPVVSMSLDSIVCVVDGAHFASDFTSGKALLELRDEIKCIRHDDTRLVSEVLIRQIEAANVIVVNKCDQNTNSERRVMLQHTLHHLNPSAQAIVASFGNVNGNVVLQPGLFDPDHPESNAGWMRELTGHHTPDIYLNEDEPDSEGVCSFVFRARKPFHAKRLHDVVVGGIMAGVVRSKGFVWIAQEPRFALEWSGAAGSITLNLSALWEVAAGRNRQNASEEAQRVWDDRWGDRKTELVFVAARCSDRPKIYRELTKALLQDDELQYDLSWWGSQSGGALESVVESASHVFNNHPAVVA